MRAEPDQPVGPALVLVSHGSRDPDAADVASVLAAACHRALPGVAVRASALDHTDPDPVTALSELAAAGVTRAVVVPLLFTAAFHVQVDLPQAIAAARAANPGLRVDDADSLADPRLLDALDRLTPDLGSGPPDARVLASAGSSDPRARAVLEGLAADWGARHGTPAMAAWASAALPDPGTAVTTLRAHGARHVLVGSLFVASGFLPDRAVTLALAAGAAGATPPLRDAVEVVAILLDRYGQTARQP